MNLPARAEDCTAGDLEIPSHHGQGLAGFGFQPARSDRDPRGCRSEKTERLGRGDAEPARGRGGGAELSPIGEADLIGSADVEGRRRVNPGVRPEHHACGIEKIQIGLADPGTQGAINQGSLTTRYPADHVPDRVRTGESRGLAGGDAELLKAVEEVVAASAA